MDKKIKRQIDVFYEIIPEQLRFMLNMAIEQDIENVTQEDLDNIYLLADKAKAERDK